jgi:hypothetical protein
MLTITLEGGLPLGSLGFDLKGELGLVAFVGRDVIWRRTGGRVLRMFKIRHGLGLPQEPSSETSEEANRG